MRQRYFRGRNLHVIAIMSLTFSLHLHAASETGYVRDEGAYFDASRAQANWLELVLRSPSKLLDSRRADQAFSHNREHPSVMKLAAGASLLVFGKPDATTLERKPNRLLEHRSGLLPVLSPATAMRLPTILFASVAAGLLALFGFAIAGGPAAWAAGLGFALLPRVFFHGHLHTFDIPVTAAILISASMYVRSRARDSWPRAIVLGCWLGISFGIKLNALFLPILFLVHAALAKLPWPTRKKAQLDSGFPWRACVVSIFLAPCVAFLTWPWIWHDTTKRLSDYLQFHSEHAYYNTAFAGENFNRPPFPWQYPFELTAASVPSTWLLLAIFGLAYFAWHYRGRRLPSTACLGFEIDTWWIWLFSIFPFLLIAWPSTPIFGGTKHWIPAYPFLAIGVALCLKGLRHHLATRMRWLCWPVAVFAIAPGAFASLWQPDSGLSTYVAAVGGPRGAADRGYIQGFWGYAGVPQYLASHAGGERNIYLHDLHLLSQQEYVRNGVWPKGLRPTALRHADTALFFPEMHFASDACSIYQALRTNRPYYLHTLADVPMLAVYTSLEVQSVK